MKVLAKYRLAVFLPLLAFLGAALAFSAFAQPTKIIQTSPLDLHLTEVGIVAEIIKPDTLRLENGKIFKLDNIRVPIQFDGMAIDFLKKNALNKTMGFYIVGKDPVARADRFGHTLSHVMNAEGEWLQAQMISRGLAWVSGSGRSRDLFIPLLKYEEAARAEESGLWGISAFAVKDNDTILHNTYNSFQVYEGTIRTMHTQGNFVFFNFDKDPKTDFTIAINKAKHAAFRLSNGAHTYAPNEFIGRRIRVRGWVEENNGPMIELQFQEQLEFLDAPFKVYYQ